jgi:hypothetical protein
MLGDIVGEFLSAMLAHLWPDGRAGTVLAWLAVAATAVGAGVAYLEGVPRLPEVLAAIATFLACLLVMGPVLHRHLGIDPDQRLR